VERPVHGQPRQVRYLAVVQPPERNGVNLYRLETRGHGGFQALEHGLELAATRDPAERVLVQRVKRDVYAAEAGGFQLHGVIGEQQAVGR
jgi:hypothetical protein